MVHRGAKNEPKLPNHDGDWESRDLSSIQVTQTRGDADHELHSFFCHPPSYTPTLSFRIGANLAGRLGDGWEVLFFLVATNHSKNNVC